MLFSGFAVSATSRVSCEGCRHVWTPRVRLGESFSHQDGCVYNQMAVQRETIFPLVGGDSRTMTLPWSEGLGSVLRTFACQRRC